MKKKILIIGAHGFLGRALWRHIKKNYTQYTLSGISRHREKGDSKIHICNINHSNKLKDILLKIQPDYIFNLSGGKFANKKKLYQSNLMATSTLLKTVSKLKAISPRIIMAGTAAEYGMPRRNNGVMSEKSRAKPVTWYGFVKLLQTKLSIAYAHNGMDVIVVRMFNVLGKGTSPSLVFGKFSQDIAMIEKKKKTPFIKTGNLNGKRDYLDVDDLCSALMHVANKGKSGQVYNICSSRSHTIKELLDQLLSFSKEKNIRIIEGKYKSSDSSDVIGSHAKLSRISRWKPQKTIHESLKETLNFYRKTLPFNSK